MASSAPALAVLRERAASEGLANISTLAGDLHELALPHDVDVVTGRHILIHVPDPFAIVCLAAGLVKPGGAVASGAAMAAPTIVGAVGRRTLLDRGSAR